MENEKNDSAQQSSSAAASGNSAPSANAPSSSVAQSSASTSVQPSMHPPKPKPILKGHSTDQGLPMFRPLGLPPMLPASSGRKSLLPHPDPRLQFARYCFLLLLSFVDLVVFQSLSCILFKG